MLKEYLCTEASCGKSFLRPEHLSRHRLNHRPKQIYQCAACLKRFVRKDLLRRHEKRHEKGMWFRNSGGYVDANDAAAASSSLQLHSQQQQQQQQQILEPAAMYTADSNDDLRGVQIVSSKKSHDGPNDADGNDDDDDLASKDGRDGCIGHEEYHNAPPMEPMDFCPDLINVNALTEDHVASLFFDPSFNIPDPSLDFEWLFDNVPADFNLAAGGSGSGGFPAAMSPKSTISSRTGISPPQFPLNSPVHIWSPPGSSHSLTTTSLSSPWITIRANLLTALNSVDPQILMSSFFHPSNLAQFYDLYFENYHPHFPILHKPTLDPVRANPLLMTAIVTLGSTLSSDAAHFEASIRIHDSLRYIIFNTGDFEPPASLWCVQTLLLIQAHEKMFSTRKHHQLSHIFHGAIITLMKRGVAYSSVQSALPPHREWTPLERSWYQWIEAQSSNRTAFFGFVMDAQHSFMFGHTCILSVHDVRLPLPCADSLWECDHVGEWNRMMRKMPESPGFLPVLKRLLGSTPIPPHCSAYSRLILLHGLFSVTAHLKARDSATLGVERISWSSSPRAGPIDTWKDTLGRAMDTWSFSLVSRSSSLALEASKPLHRMAYVAIYTDITDIHVLAGAPSLIGSLLSPNDRLRATARVRAWSEKPESKKALYHCLLLIQEVIFTGQQYRASMDNIALRPWSLYHAALILWAYGVMAGDNQAASIPPSSSTSTSSLDERRPSCSAEEYLVRMLMLLRNESEEINAVARQTRELLQAVRESLEGCRWELLQEAYETMGRLIDKPRPE